MLACIFGLYGPLVDSPATFHICGHVAKSTEILAQPLLPKLLVLIWLSTGIVSFPFSSAEKLAACLQCSHRTSSQGLISISSNQN